MVYSHSSDDSLRQDANRYHNSQIYNAFDAIGIITYDHHGHYHDDKDFHLDVLDVIGVITQNRR